MTKRKIIAQRLICVDTRGATLSKMLSQHISTPIFTILSTFGLICSYLDPTFMQWGILTQVDTSWNQYTKKSEVTRCFFPTHFALSSKIPNQVLIYFSHLSVLNRKYIYDDGLRYLSSMKKLIRLELTRSMHISDLGAQIVSQLNSLEHLVFAGIEKITDNGLQHLWSLKNLKTLMIGGGCVITDSGFKGIINLTALTKLDIIGFPLITKSCLNGLLQVPCMSELKVYLCDNIQDIFLQDRKSVEQYINHKNIYHLHKFLD